MNWDHEYLKLMKTNRRFCFVQLRKMILHSRRASHIHADNKSALFPSFASNKNARKQLKEILDGAFVSILLIESSLLIQELEKTRKCYAIAP